MIPADGRYVAVYRTPAALAGNDDESDYRTVIGWNSTGQPVVVNPLSGELTPAHRLPGFDHIVESHHPPIVGVLPAAPGWRVEYDDPATDDGLRLPVLGWAINVDGYGAAIVPDIGRPGGTEIVGVPTSLAPIRIIGPGMAEQPTI